MQPDSSGIWKVTRTSLVVFCILAALGVLAYSMKGFFLGNETNTNYVLYTVNKGDLPIVVTERGSLESQNQTLIRCQVEASRDRGGNYGTAIIFIVPNGSAVKEGELLFELDSATIRDSLEQQELSYQRAISAKTQAVAKWKNQLLQNKTQLAEAELAVELAKLDLESYEDKEAGTLQLEVDAIEREIDELNNSILQARGKLKFEEINQTGVEELFKLGYRTKRQLDQSRLDFLTSEFGFTAAINKLENKKGVRRQLEQFKAKMDILRLGGKLETSLRAKDQVINDNVSLEDQALAAKLEAEKTEEKEKDRLARLETQLEYCKVDAPHDGMVVYVRERRGGTEIAEGAMVRERQGILTLPNLSHMQVKTQVHEAVLDQVVTGLKASVRVDAFPDKVFDAEVQQVAVVPSESWMSTKTYETIVTINDEVESLKPGMTAVVDIRVERIRDVLTVPVQAVTQVGGDNWCYLALGGGQLERRPIELGRSNDKFVHIREGIKQGDQVVLNPMDIVDERDKENEISPDAGQLDSPSGPEEPTSSDSLVKAPKANGKANKANAKSGAGMKRAGKKGGSRRPTKKSSPKVTKTVSKKSAPSSGE